MEKEPTKSYRFPPDLIQLRYSKHATERLRERTTGQLIVAPKYLRLTPENTIDIQDKNGRVTQATAFIQYKRNILMFLPIVVSSGIVKTVYFKNVKKKQVRKREKHRIKKYIPTSEDLIKEKQREEYRAEEARKRGLRENVEFIQPNLGRIARYKAMFCLWWKDIWSK